MTNKRTSYVQKREKKKVNYNAVEGIFIAILLCMFARHLVRAEERVR